MGSRTVLVLAATLALGACGENASRSPDPIVWNEAPGFWIWNRGEALPAASIADLDRAKSTRCYWQVAELVFGAQNQPVPSPPRIAQLREISAIPVIRLAPGADSLTDASTLAALDEMCAALFADSSQNRLQLDFDCPTSALGTYARLLSRLRSQFDIGELSITALASWIDAPDFRSLAASVDECVPMFYDLRPDTPADILAGNPAPMIDKTTLRWIEKWRKSPTPWRAGLPNFQRITLFEADGTLVGHHRNWTPETLFTHPAVEVEAPQTLGVVRFRITADTDLFGSRARKGQLLLWRLPDESLAVLALETARNSGASGAVWFAHPDSAPIAWHSVSHLAALQSYGAADPDPAVRTTPDGSIILTNKGPGDIPARADPWRLVFESESPGRFGSADPGSFTAIDAPGASLAHPEFSRTIHLTFQSLPAQGELRSGSGLLAAPDFPPGPAQNSPPPWHIQPAP